MYGGASLNAMHALMQTLVGSASRAAGAFPSRCAPGVVAPSDAELAAWKLLPAGPAEIAAAGSRPADPAAADEFYLRTWAEPSVDVHGIQGGSPVLQKTVIAVEAEANVSIRLVGDQDPAVIAPAFEALLREAAPAGAEVEITMLSSAPPGLIPADAPAVLLGLDAFEEVLGVRPLLVRSGGAIPLVSELAARGVATVLTGFALNESNIHSPNERIPAAYLPLGIETAAALYRTPRRPWVALRSPRRSPRSCPTACSSASSATSGSTRSRRRDASTYPSTAKQLDLSRMLVDELREIGLDDVELNEHGYVLRDAAGHAGRAGDRADRARRHDAGVARRRSRPDRARGLRGRADRPRPATRAR